MLRDRVSCAGGVVVGHDGSRAAAPVVRRAAALAAKLGVPLHVVRPWTVTNAPRPPSMTCGYVPPTEEFEQAVLADLERQIGGIELPAACTVVLHAPHGGLSHCVLDAAPGAELLVVGSGRGRGRLAGVRAGLVAEALRHSPVPVVVVPATDE